MPMLSWGVGVWVWEESRPLGSQWWAMGWRWSGGAPQQALVPSGIGQGGVLTADSR